MTLILGAFFISCDDAEPAFFTEDEAVVDFEYEIKGDCSTRFLEVVLENGTANADSYLWNFGDGTTSNVVNPKKIYPKSGNYTINLTAYFAKDTIQTEKQIAIIRNSDGTGPFGQLSFTRSNASNLELTFEVATDEPSYSLFFGDGTIISSSQKMIKHQYEGPGRYSALLVVQNTEGCNCSTAIIDLTP